MWRNCVVVVGMQLRGACPAGAQDRPMLPNILVSGERCCDHHAPEAISHRSDWQAFLSRPEHVLCTHMQPHTCLTCALLWVPAVVLLSMLGGPPLTFAPTLPPAINPIRAILMSTRYLLTHMWGSMGCAVGWNPSGPGRRSEGL